MTFTEALNPITMFRRKAPRWRPFGPQTANQLNKHELSVKMLAVEVRDR